MMKLLKLLTNLDQSDLHHCFVQDLIDFLKALLEIGEEEEDISWALQTNVNMGKGSSYNQDQRMLCLEFWWPNEDLKQLNKRHRRERLLEYLSEGAGVEVENIVICGLNVNHAQSEEGRTEMVAF